MLEAQYISNQRCTPRRPVLPTHILKAAWAVLCIQPSRRRQTPPRAQAPPWVADGRPTVCASRQPLASSQFCVAMPPFPPARKSSRQDC
jgi:hypothetical protein